MNLDSVRLQLLNDAAGVKLDDVLSALGVDLRQTRKIYHGPCPIHEGDNPMGLNFFRHRDDATGTKWFWKCHTNRCHETFRQTVLGFVWGVLSRQKHGWARPGDRAATFGEAIQFLARSVGMDLDNIEVNPCDLAKMRLSALYGRNSPEARQAEHGVLREKVREHLTIPSRYYQGRGYSPQILDKYDVGEMSVRGHPASHRVVVPIYDDTHSFVVGWTARSLFDPCPKCRSHHDPTRSCPELLYRTAYGKWKHKAGFDANNHLYNYWFAARPIRQTGTVVLVEGPGDVWRLEEAGVHVGLGMLKAGLADQQAWLIQRLAPRKVLVLTDSDNAGHQARSQIKQQLGRVCRLSFLDLPKKDVGELTPDEVRQIVGHHLTKG